MHRRLAACLRRLRVSTPEAAQALLQSRPEFVQPALDSMLLGVSSFFRDSSVFDFIASETIPELLEVDGALRVLSLGVSGGQELYSIAMLLAEAGALHRSALLGVDCRADAIRQATTGVFAEESMEGLTAERRERFFHRCRWGWRATAELRSAMDFQVADLFGFRQPESDLVLFRNVAIYLEEAAAGQVWRSLCDALRPGGYVVTGKAENPPRDLPLVRVFPSVYRKR